MCCAQYHKFRCPCLDEFIQHSWTYAHHREKVEIAVDKSNPFVIFDVSEDLFERSLSENLSYSGWLWRICR